MTLAVSTRSGTARSGIAGSGDPDLLPPDLFSKHAELGLISVAYNYQNAVWQLDYSRQVRGKAVHSFAAKLGRRVPATRRAPSCPIIRSIRRPFQSISRRRHPERTISIRRSVTGQGHRHRHRLRGHRRPILHPRPGARWAEPTCTSSERKRSSPDSPIYLGWIPALLLARARACWAGDPEQVSGPRGPDPGGHGFDSCLLAPIASRGDTAVRRHHAGPVRGIVVVYEPRPGGGGSSAVWSTPSRACRTSARFARTRPAATRR